MRPERVDLPTRATAMPRKRSSAIAGCARGLRFEHPSLQATGSAAPYTKLASGRGGLPQARRQPVPPRELADAHAPVHAGARADRPSSSRSAFCRRSVITVKTSRFARALRVALRASLECDHSRQDPGACQEDGGI
jgi:hypothetical protein